MKYDLTKGSILRNLIFFSVPYLISSFLQTFYGLMDLFIVGQFNSEASITGVAVGSQLMHFLTVVIVGLAMGSTVSISHCVGAGDEKGMKKTIGNTVVIFTMFAFVVTVILLLSVDGIMTLLKVPPEALTETSRYAYVCFAGVPFIVFYNVIASVFRGLGDSRRPMYFVFVAGIINIVIYYVLIGPFGMGSLGAAVGTVAAQAFSVVFSLVYIKISDKTAFSLDRDDFRLSSAVTEKILKVGLPISVQDACIQIAFLTITMIANMRGVQVAAAVGIVEKIIGFLFLVPSAMLSTVSAFAAQNSGAGRDDRAFMGLYLGTAITVAVGLVFALICNINAEMIVSMFAKNEPEVVKMGAQYLKSYSFDCPVAGIHFCFSGFFSAYQKSMISFVHNIISIVTMRIPGAYYASVHFPDTLFPMGMAAPLGSAISALICILVFVDLKKKGRFSIDS